MKASELRIGNYIQDKKDREISILQVAHIGEGLINYWMESVYQPIPLSEEWLVKFGFEAGFAGISEFIMDVNRTSDDWNSIDSFRISHSSNGKWEPEILILGDMLDPNDYMSLNQIEYVHQLQNLYFALTGEELTIKE